MALDPNFQKTLENFQQSVQKKQTPKQVENINATNDPNQGLNNFNDGVSQKTTQTANTSSNPVFGKIRATLSHYHIKEIGTSIIATLGLDFIKFLSEYNFDLNKFTTYGNGNALSNAIFAFIAWIISYILVRLQLRPIIFFQNIVNKTQTK
jgi:hypothetical protein